MQYLWDGAQEVVFLTSSRMIVEEASLRKRGKEKEFIMSRPEKPELRFNKNRQ